MNAICSDAARLQALVSRKGAQVTIRRSSKLPAGPAGLLNPPRLTGTATIAANLAAGATHMPLSAPGAVGRLVMGDLLLISPVALPVMADAPALPLNAPGGGGWAAVPIEPLPFDMAAGTPVGFLWSADLRTFGMINSFPIRLVDGERIKARDLSILVSAYGLPAIDPTWTVLAHGREMSIVGATPAFKRDDIVSWTIQAR